MSKYKKQQQPSAETINEAAAIARAIQKPNQTKEQTRLIAQGIQKGIAEYKKQQKGKARELSKLKKQLIQKKTEQKQQSSLSADIEINEVVNCKTQWFPWILLIISWLSIAVFLTVQK